MRIVLVGEKFERSENLALEVLQAALEAAGRHRVEQVALGGLHEIANTAREVLRRRPRLVGISIGYQVGAMTALALVHQLRRSGYHGHITAGGAFATLHAAEVLRDAPLDSVVLFAGERPLVSLAAHVERGGPVDQIPGLMLRTPEGGVRRTAPPLVWEDPFPYRPARSGPSPEHLGVRTASIYASRGCEARCSYCCVAQLTDAARTQARAAGRPAGAVPRIRRRHPCDVADEIRDLQRDRQVQLFRFEDDCLLGGSPRTASRYLLALQEAMQARGVDAPAFTFKLRPDCVTPDIAASLADVGMIHGFIGIEAMTDETLRRIGRASQVSSNRIALRALADAAIPAYFNALIVGPDATLASIGADLDALDEVSSAPLDIATLVLYAGTPLFDRLEARGAIRGNYLCWRYEFEDPRVAVVAKTLARLPTRHTGAYTIGKRIADLQLNVAIARRFHPQVSIATTSCELGHLTRLANSSTVAVARRVIAWARTTPSAAEQTRFWRELAAEVTAHDRAFASHLESMVAELEKLVNADQPNRVSAFLRSGLAAAMLGGVQLLSPGCECGSRPATDSGAVVDVGVDSGSADSGWLDSGMADSGFVDSGGSDSGGDDSGLGADAGACVNPVPANEAAWLETNAAEPCVTPICTEVLITFSTDGSGTVTNVNGNITPAEEACIIAALSGVCFPGATSADIGVSLFGPCD